MPHLTQDGIFTVFDLTITKAQGILVCGGDFNICLNFMLNSSKNTKEPKLLIKKINGLFKEIGIIDVWRELNPKVRDYTYYSYPHKIYFRIDYFLVFEKDLHLIVHCE